MKFTQIAVATSAEGDDSLYALGDDGIVYIRSATYGRDEYGGKVWRYWWEPIDMQVGDPQKKAENESDHRTVGE
jgi:hypothetical protein